MWGFARNSLVYYMYKPDHGDCSRAKASLTVPGGQEFHFPHFFPKFWSFFLIFPQTFLIFFLILALQARVSRWAPRPPGKALATPLDCRVSSSVTGRGGGKGGEFPLKISEKGKITMGIFICTGVIKVIAFLSSLTRKCMLWEGFYHEKASAAPWTPEVTSPPLMVYPGAAPDSRNLKNSIWNKYALIHNLYCLTDYKFQWSAILSSLDNLLYDAYITLKKNDNFEKKKLYTKDVFFWTAQNEHGKNYGYIRGINFEWLIEASPPHTHTVNIIMWSF